MLEYLVSSILPGYELPDLQRNLITDEIQDYDPGVYASVEDGQVQLEFRHFTSGPHRLGQRHPIAVRAELDQDYDCLMILCADMTEGWLDATAGREDNLLGVTCVSPTNLLCYLDTLSKAHLPLS